MTVAPEFTPEEDILTPTVRRFFRKTLFWIGITTILIIIAGIGLVFSGSLFASEDELGPDNAAPEGARALVEVLKHEGVDVVVATSLEDAQQAVDDPNGTTLVIHDVSRILTDEQWRDAVGLADNVVLIDPGFTALTAIAPSVYSAGYVDGDLDADCDVAAAEAAGTISGSGSGFQTDGDTVAACFDSGDDTYSLIQVDYKGALVTMLGATDALSNGRIVENGNAALALTLLGSEANLVWYVPGPHDYDDAPLTVADLAPKSVFPITLTLLLVFVAIAVWRGRRFGPLIIENLPVTVKASETMHGRARLYQHSTARLHALDSLRIGTIDRLARLIGLPRLATVDEVVSGVASLLGRDERDVRRLLLDAAPKSDRELIALSDELLILESAVTSRLRNI